MMNNNDDGNGSVDLTTTTRDAKRQRIVATSSIDEDQVVVLNEEEKKIYDDVVSDSIIHSSNLYDCFLNDRYNGTELELKFLDHHDVFDKNHTAAKMIGKISKYITKNSPSEKVVFIRIRIAEELDVGGIKILLSPFMTTIACLDLAYLDETMMETLPQTLRHCSSLESLSLEIASGSLLQLTRLIEQLPTLKSTEISFRCASRQDVFQKVDLGSINGLIRSFCRLEDVRLEYFPGSLAFFLAGTLCSNSSTIRKLNLIIDDKCSYQPPWNTKTTNPKLKNTSLEHLELWNLGDKETAEALLKTLPICPALKELELRITSSSLMQLARLIEHAPSLQSLKLHFADSTSSVFEDADMESIRDLALCMCRLEEVNIWYIPGSLASLASNFLETLCSKSTAIRKLKLHLRFPWTTGMTDAILKSTTLETFRLGRDPAFRAQGYTEADESKIENHLEGNKRLNKARGLLEYHATMEQKEKEGKAGSSNFPAGLWADAIETLTSSPNGNPAAAYLLVRSQLPKWILNNNNNNNNN